MSWRFSPTNVLCLQLPLQRQLQDDEERIHHLACVGVRHALEESKRLAEVTEIVDYADSTMKHAVCFMLQTYMHIDKCIRNTSSAGNILSLTGDKKANGQM